MPVNGGTADMINCALTVNSFEVRAEYHREDADCIFLPLLRTLTDAQRRKGGRLIVFLAAPPGMGKTTLSLFWERLSRGEGLTPVQAAGLDGFHHFQKYLEAHTVTIDGKDVPMKSIKGAPETFDLKKVADKLQELREHEACVKWPIYDRTLHDVVEDGVLITEKIALIEGNWLLLDEPGWRKLKNFCDYSVFVHAPEEMLRGRLIERKIRGGLSEEKAREFYENSDVKNVRRALSSRLDCDLELRLGADGKYISGKEVV